MAGQTALGLLAAVAEVGKRAHTDVTLVQELARVIGRWWPVRCMELGRRAAGDSATAVVFDSADGVRAQRVTRALDGSLMARAMREVRTQWVEPLSRGSATDLRGARMTGATRAAVLPLCGESSSAYLIVGLDRARPGDVEPSAELLDAVATVVSTLADHVQLLGRVAALSKRALAEKNELALDAARARPVEVVAVDRRMRQLFDEVVPTVARHDTTVLLTGETGTGKEVVARQIHRLSCRARRPFLKVNCGAVPETLIDSVLFGHERGAFSGAIQRHTGLFERAHGGTLLLDEVGEMSPAAQVKLLRVLQEGEIERVGGQATIRVDVRIIAATHRDLGALVASGAFRSDLFYRLHVVPIAVPPLRERRADIAALVEAILLGLARRFHRAVPTVSAAVMKRLSAHSWPGNVRELENVLERALVMSPASQLVLPIDFGTVRAPSSKAPAMPTVESYRDAQRRCIESALASSGGRVYGPAGAAAALAMKPTTLQSKMKKLGIGSARRAVERS